MYCSSRLVGLCLTMLLTLIRLQPAFKIVKYILIYLIINVKYVIKINDFS